MQRIGTARQQLWLFFGAYMLYAVGRFAAASDVGPATENAHQIIDLENSLGIGVERSVQDALNDGVVMWLFSNIYLAAQFVVLPAALVWLYRRAPEIYGGLRNTVIASWALALIPRLGPRTQTEAAACLDAGDLPILAMSLAGTPPPDIAATLGLDQAQLAGRMCAMFARLIRAHRNAAPAAARPRRPCGRRARRRRPRCRRCGSSAGAGRRPARRRGASRGIGS
jgi:hypothetical protein